MRQERILAFSRKQDAHCVKWMSLSRVLLVVVFLAAHRLYRCEIEPIWLPSQGHPVLGKG